MAILVTGGAGFIGSHTCTALLDAGEEIVVLDNFCNSKPSALENIRQITGKDFPFYETNLLDRAGVEKVFSENDIEIVIHFAGLKAVGESVQKPLEYYHNNITGTLVLCDVMRDHDVKKIVFSSSATVYGNPASVPIQEDFPLSTTNPYGSTKLMLEQILTDLNISDDTWNVTLLRYFNPIGAHKSGLLGENPNGIPNNLMPYICQVAASILPQVNVFGDDYPTPDGTGVRDYIHVLDLADGHVKAVLGSRKKGGVNIYNLGTGKGYSVLDIIHAFEKANNLKIPYQVTPRRAGDIPECYADAAKAREELGWEAQYDLQAMCKDSWNFIQKNK